jgi:hypothetical protein
MAALLLTGIAVGADKINQKRKQRKAEKAAKALEEPPIYDGLSQCTTQAMTPNTRSAKEIEAEGERRRSSSEERDAPPAYENVPAYDDKTNGVGAITANRRNA